MRDFAWGATRSVKPLHKICDFGLMFDAHIRDGHLHYPELLFDTFHPFVLTLQVDVTVDSVMLSPAVSDLNHCLPLPYSTRPGSAPVCLP
jgi:hypothetical protein